MPEGLGGFLRNPLIPSRRPKGRVGIGTQPLPSRNLDFWGYPKSRGSGMGAGVTLAGSVFGIPPGSPNLPHPGIRDGGGWGRLGGGQKAGPPIAGLGRPPGEGRPPGRGGGPSPLPNRPNRPKPRFWTKTRGMGRTRQNSVFLPKPEIGPL